jgi:hypothetical protein
MASRRFRGIADRAGPAGCPAQSRLTRGNQTPAFSSRLSRHTAYSRYTQYPLSPHPNLAPWPLLPPFQRNRACYDRKASATERRWPGYSGARVAMPGGEEAWGSCYGTAPLFLYKGSGSGHAYQTKGFCDALTRRTAVSRLVLQAPNRICNSHGRVLRDALSLLRPTLGAV